MGDPNMEVAWLLGTSFGQASLPASLSDIAARASLVAQIDGPLLLGKNDPELFSNLGRRLRSCNKITVTFYYFVTWHCYGADDLKLCSSTLVESCAVLY
jgi:hypothetical protein